MAGRPTTYTKAADQAAKDYLAQYSEHGHPFPSIVGMAIVISVAKSTLYKWVDDNRTGELGDFSDTLDQCQDHQERITLNKSITNEFNPTISKLVLANFGYHDKQDSTLSGKDGGAVQIQEVKRTIVDA